jgi:spore coat protein U-like protein
MIKGNWLGALLVLLMFGATPAFAQNCGVTGSAQASSSITYDPFGPNGLQQITIPLILTRYAVGGAKTQTANFVLTKPAGTPNYQVLYNGVSVLYTEGATGGRPSIGAQTAGEISYNFGGASAPDQSTPFNLLLTVPAGLDLSAGQPIRFDISYVCNGTGGMKDVTIPTKLISAIQINVNVLSALQASYVGPALDFGEVGLKNDAQAPTDPGPRTGYIRVASSGPYSIELRSEKGFRLSYPGGNPAVANQAIAYQAALLGQTRNPTDSSSIRQVCSRAGLATGSAGQGVRIPVTVTLLQGGQNKLPAPSYLDNLIVTITPLLDPQSGVTCGAP